MSTNTHPYLKNKKVRIVPTPAGKRWNGKVSKDTEGKMKELPFLHHDAVKGYCAPVKDSGIYPFLDNQTRNACPDVLDKNGEPTMLTEQEYFEKRLKLNLDPYGKDTDWFHVRNGDMGYKPTYVYIKNGELSLDLANPANMLTYRLAQQRPDKIASSKEMYNMEKRETQIFMFVDEVESNEELVDLITAKAEASSKFLSMSGKRKEMLTYFACKGTMLSDKMSDVDLKAKFALDYDKDPVEFLKYANDKDAELKYLIRKARMNNLIEHNPKTDIYRTETFSGKLSDLIYHLRSPLNSEELLELELKVEQI